MTSAKVNVREIDLSTRVPQFPGAFGAMVVPARKGVIGEATLVTSESQFLSLYTPDERLEIGFDNAHFSALMFLEKSDKLWVSRAANASKFGGAVFRDGSTGGGNTAINAGLDDPIDYAFDTGIDVPAIKEITTFQVPAGSTVAWDLAGAGKHFLLDAQDGTLHYVWMNITDGANAQSDPAVGGRVGIQVDFLAADTEIQKAVKIAAALDLIANYDVPVPTTDTLTVTQAVAGLVADAVDVDSTGTVLVTLQGVDLVSGVDEVLLLTPKNQGDWGNRIAVKLTNFVTDPTLVQEPDSFLIEVFRTDNLQVPVETWNGSRDPAAKTADGRSLFVDTVLEASAYIQGLSNPAIVETVAPQDQLTPLTMASGDDGLVVTDADMIAAAQIYKNKDNMPISILMDGGFATPIFGAELNLIAETRQDCVAILSVPFADEASANYMNDIVDYRKNILNLNSTYAALYSPHVQIYDKFNDRNLYIAPDGFAGGAISLSAANFEIWYPPAGAKRGLINAQELKRRFDVAQRDLLQLNGINPLRFTPGKGIMIFGQKTLSARPSALDRLNVRLLLTVIEPAIEVALEDFLFDLNDVATRSLASSIIISYMDNIQARRGVSDYRVIIDSTNNTAEDIDNNRMNVDVFVKPTRSVEEINLRVIITRTSISFDSASTQV